MSTLETITIAAGSGDTVTQALTKLRDNQIKLEICRADTSDPTSPANGEEWVRTDGANNGQKYAWINGAKTEVLYQYALNQDLDLNGNEVKNAVQEKLATGSLPAAGAATEGEVPWDSTVERLVSISSTEQHYLARCNLDGTDYISIPLSLADDLVTGPATNPTAVTDNEWKGWLFDAAGTEELLLSAVVPAGWTTSHDLILRLTCALQGAETANDDIKWDCDWASITPGTGDALNKTETAATVSSTDIGAVNADLDVHDCDITIDHDDATNPVARGDLLKMVISISALAGAGEIDNGVALLYAQLLVPAVNYNGA
jgi:hypothetical protein